MHNVVIYYMGHAYYPHQCAFAAFSLGGHVAQGLIAQGPTWWACISITFSMGLCALGLALKGDHLQLLLVYICGPDIYLYSAKRVPCLVGLLED